MKDLLTERELRFLSWHGVDPNDVFDGRYHHRTVWKELVRGSASNADR
jgi:hypothetical protein